LEGVETVFVVVVFVFVVDCLSSFSLSVGPTSFRSLSFLDSRVDMAKTSPLKILLLFDEVEDNDVKETLLPSVVHFLVFFVRFLFLVVISSLMICLLLLLFLPELLKSGCGFEVDD